MRLQERQAVRADSIMQLRPEYLRKSRSNVTHSQPHSIASAAYQVSVAARPRVLVSVQSLWKMSQWRSPGSIVSQWG